MYLQTGHTALIIVSEKGHVEVVQLLIKRGANVNISNNVRYIIVWLYLCLCACINAYMHVYVCTCDGVANCLSASGADTGGVLWVLKNPPLEKYATS